MDDTQTDFGTKKLYRLEPGVGAAEFIERRLAEDGHPATVVFWSGAAGESPDPVHTGLLEKILDAAGIDPGKRIVVDAGAYPELRLRMLKRAFPTLQHVLVFGVRPGRIGLNAEVDLYTPLPIGDYTVLAADPLKHISDNESSKRLLWNAMKEMYGL